MDVKIIHQASLVRDMFIRNLRKNLNTIKEPTLGTDSETSIKVLKCDRKSMQFLQAHYDGPSEGAQIKQVCRHKLM